MGSSALGFAIAAISPASTSPQPPTQAAVDAYYESVLTTMQGLPIPPPLRFETSMHADGAGIDVYDDDGKATMAVGFGGDFSHDKRWSTAFESGVSTVTTSDGHRQSSNAPLFDPTWQGAYDWLRYGSRGKPGPALATSPSPSPPQTTDPAPEQLRTLAFVRSMSTGYYSVTDAGASMCPSGGSGKHLHLVARRDPKSHPVTDVVVDDALLRICSLTFDVGSSSFMGVSGTYTLDFTPVAGSWLVSGGASDLRIRVFGLKAKHVALRFRNTFDDLTPAGA